MAKQYRIKRKIGNMAITAGGFATIDLPRDYDYESIKLRISASVQVTVLATSVRAEAPSQLVPRVEVIADGKNALYSAPFWYGGLGNVRRKLTESGGRVTTPPSGVAVATYAVEGISIIDFATFDGVRPKDSNFRSRGLSLFQLRLTFGQPGDVFVGGTVVFSGTPTVEVWATQLVEETSADGKFISNPIALRKVSFQEQAFAASNANAEIRLPAGNLIRSVFVRTDGSATAGEPSTAVLNNLTLQNGIDVRHNLSGPQVRLDNNGDYGQVLSGYYLADMMARGTDGNLNLTDLWDVTGASEPKAILDVTGGANVKIQAVTEEYILAAA